MQVQIFQENLCHMACPVCKGWWAVGDAPDREYWYCPWCGLKLDVNDFEPVTRKKKFFFWLGRLMLKLV